MSGAVAATLPIVTRGMDGVQAGGTLQTPAAGAVGGPLVSCLMVTRGDRPAVAHAIDCYRRQSYAHRELVIVSAGDAPCVVPLLDAIGDPTIRFVRAAPAPLGTLRNLLVAEAAGPLVCIWDDDDLSHARRIEVQLAALAYAGAAASFILSMAIWWPRRQRIAIASPRFWEASMLARKAALPRYPAIDLGEDYALVDALRGTGVLTAIDWPTGYCYVGHGDNSCGDAHFERLWWNAGARFEGEMYERALAELAAEMPVRGYLGTLR